MWTSSVFVGPNQCGSQTSSMICSRVQTSPAFAISMWSRSNSFAASSTVSPSFVTVRDGGIERERADRDRAPGRRGRAASAHDRPHARDELAGAERLHDVVVGAELEAHDPVDLLAASGEHDDRDVGGRRISRHRSRPSPSGSITSSRTRSGSPRSKRGRASSSVPATSGSNPSRAQVLGERLGDARSSSTTSTRGFMQSMVAARSGNSGGELLSLSLKCVTAAG